MTSMSGPLAASISPPRLIQTSTAEVLRRLELLITRRLDGLLQGDYQGLAPGHGAEPGEAREYEPGDDVRRIDWNVTARMQRTHVRETIADRELETWILADVSASLDFGTANCDKRDLALAAAAAVGFLTNRGGNRLGGVVLDAEGRAQAMPARSGRAQVMAFLHRMAAAPRTDGGGDTDLAGGIDRVASLMPRAGLAVVVSDFLSLTDWELSMRRLAVRHDVLGIEVIDPRELELADVGLLTMVDAESGAEREVQTSDAGLRARYAEAAAEQRREIAGRIRAAGADHLRLRTDRDWIGDLVRFVTIRRRRIENLPRTIR
ncbi:MAG: DUF58 domain-containing protein [Acidimicrobiales bacterium]